MTLFLWVCVASIACIALFAMREIRSTTIEQVRYSLDAAAEQSAVLPLLLDESGARSMSIHMAFHAPHKGSAEQVLFWHGCLRSASLNNRPLSLGENLCDDGRGQRIVFPALLPGINTLALQIIPNTQTPLFLGFFGMRPSLANTWALHSVIAALFCMAVVAAFAVFTAKSRLLSIVFFLGIALRFLVVCITPLGLRTSDSGGHLEYLHIVLQGTALPAYNVGWQTYQPPLFYWVAAAWVRMTAWLSGLSRPFLEDAQVLTFILSVLTLAMAFVCVRILYSSSERREPASTTILCMLLVACSPGFVLHAASVTNDALLSCLAFAYFAALLRWHARQDYRSWWLVCFLLCLGLLTKSNALVWIGLACVALVQRRMLVGTSKFVSLFMQLVMAITVLCGWLFVQRFVLEGQGTLVGNIQLLPDVYRVPTTPMTLFLFNPFDVLQQPLTTIQSSTFLEYLFKTAHFGAAAYPAQLTALAQLLLLNGMILVLLCVLGMYVYRNRGCNSLATWSLALFLLSQYAYRIIHPYSFNQHARFSPLLPLLVAYGATFAVSHMPPKYRQLAESYFVSCALCAMAFVIGLAGAA